MDRKKRSPNIGLSIEARDNVIIIPTTFTTDGPNLLKPPIEVLPNPPDIEALAAAMTRAIARSGRFIDRPGGQDYREAAYRAAGCRKESEYIKGLKHVSVFRSGEGISISPGIPYKHGSFSYGDPAVRIPGEPDWILVAKAVVTFLSDDLQTPPHPGLRAKSYPKPPWA